MTLFSLVALAQEAPAPETPGTTSLPPITISDSPVTVGQLDGEVMPAAMDNVEMVKLMVGATGRSSILITSNANEERTAQFALPTGFALEDGGDTVALPPHSTVQVKFTYQLAAPPPDRTFVVTEDTVVVTLVEDSSYSGEFGVTGVYLAMKPHRPM